MKFLIACLLSISAAYSQGGSFGGGIVLGNLTGFSGNNFIDKDISIDGALGFDVDDEFEFYATFLMWKKGIAQIETVKLDLYYGIGAKYENHDDESDFFFGPRVPVGLSHRLSNVPWEFNFEVSGFYALIEDTDFDLEFGLIARYYF